MPDEVPAIPLPDEIKLSETEIGFLRFLLSEMRAQQKVYGEAVLRAQEAKRVEEQANGAYNTLKSMVKKRLDDLTAVHSIPKEVFYNLDENAGVLRRAK